MLPEPIAVTIKVTGVLEKLGIPYLIGGSLASTLYGMVRTTQGSDIITEIRSEHIQPFVASLQNEFFMDEEMIAESIQRNSSLIINDMNNILLFSRLKGTTLAWFLLHFAQYPGYSCNT